MKRPRIRWIDSDLVGLVLYVLGPRTQRESLVSYAQSPAWSMVQAETEAARIHPKMNLLDCYEDCADFRSCGETSHKRGDRHDR